MSNPGPWNGSWYYPDYSCPPPGNFLNYPPPAHTYVAPTHTTITTLHPPQNFQGLPPQPIAGYATNHVAYPTPYPIQNSTLSYTPSPVIFNQPPPPIHNNPGFSSACHNLQPPPPKELTTKDAKKRSPSPPPRRKRRSRSPSPRRMRPSSRNRSKSPHYRDRRSSSYMPEKSNRLHRRDRSPSKRRSSLSPSRSPSKQSSSSSRRSSRSPSRCSSKRRGLRSPSRCSSRQRSPSRRRTSHSPSKRRTTRRPSKSRQSTNGPSHYAREERSSSHYSVSRASTSHEFSRPSSRTEGSKPRVSVKKEPTADDVGSHTEKIPEEPDRKQWTRSTPADLYYIPDLTNSKVMKGTVRLEELCTQFKEKLVDRAARARKGRPVYEPPPRRHKPHLHKCRRMPGSHKPAESSSSCSSDSDASSSSEDEVDCSIRELERKRLHPDRLHPELWFNDPGEMNDGPLCRCSAKAQRSGIRHGIYAGETPLTPCDPNTNNLDRLYHYRITIAPPTNFLTKVPTIIRYDGHEFIFEGFSMFSHSPLASLPICKVIRFNIQYAIVYVEEKSPENFTIAELSLFFDYLFNELLELVDLDFKAAGDKNGCPRFHFLPRFVRELPDNGIEILSMNRVLSYLLEQSKPLIEQEALATLLKMPQFDWQNFADEVKGMLVTYPGAKPCSLRVDQIDREQQTSDFITFPEIVHFGIRPPQLSYAGNAEYQREWREYVKLRHLVANMPKPSFEDKRRLESKENKLQEMRMQNRMKRDVTVAVSAQDFHRTGIMCDIIQHAMLVPVLVCHLRFHQSLDTLEKVIEYKFTNRYLLQLALTHPSYRENFGTNPDHARNSLTNCGIRQPEYGDRRIHYLNTRKRGINTLINIMSRFGKKCETESNITHNERLEFLGDAVVEFLSSIHLFYMFPDLEEGGLATYRAAIVQNQHLAVLAKTLKLEEYMLYAHGSDLCHDLELRHAMANCFEALMGALFLDGGIDVADKVFALTFFHDDTNNLDIWINCPKHPLQEQEPDGDRHWISQFKLLEKLTLFEESIGVEFNHIRLLARAFTDRSIGYNNLTLGSNQRLEFLGDTVLQLIASEYLYKHFPEHHEGHLSLLRSSLVNNRTQAVVCDDLGMTYYALYSNPKAELKTKDRADLLEAFLGALYVDVGMKFCETFCNVCFFPRLQDFIMNQDWNDPKSKLQQCCLTLRTMDGGEPDIPIYKVIECKGPTNTRIYSVAVYFRGERLATATGHSIQMAEMNAAKSALQRSQSLFPQLNHQKRVIAKSMKRQKRPREGTRHVRSPSPRRSQCSSRRSHPEYKTKERRTGGSWAPRHILDSPGKYEL